jgi:hypothetical protein
MSDDTPLPFDPLMGTVSLFALSAAGVLIASPAAHAHITKIQITSQQSPFGGYAFEGVGPYEKIVGEAFGELDPRSIACCGRGRPRAQFGWNRPPIGKGGTGAGSKNHRQIDPARGDRRSCDPALLIRCYYAQRLPVDP